MTDRSPTAIHEFPYHPNRWLVLGLFLLCIAGLVMFGYMGFFSHGGVNARGLRLNEDQQHWLFRLLFALSPIGLIPLGASVYFAWFKKRRVAVTSDSLLCPKTTRLGLSCQEIEIPFRSIHGIGLRPFMGSAQMLRIEHTGGVIPLFSNMFPSKAIFNDAVNCVQNAVRHYHDVHRDARAD